MLALSAEKEAIEAFVLADRVDLVPAAGEHFVHVALVADIEEQLVLRCIEDAVQGDGEFHYTQIGAEVATGFGKGFDQRLANNFRQHGQLFDIQVLDVSGRANAR